MVAAFLIDQVAKIGQIGVVAEVQAAEAPAAAAQHADASVNVAAVACFHDAAAVVVCAVADVDVVGNNHLPDLEGSEM